MEVNMEEQRGVKYSNLMEEDNERRRNNYESRGKSQKKKIPNK
jgi:hypothetical protein